MTCIPSKRRNQAWWMIVAATLVWRGGLPALDAAVPTPPVVSATPAATTTSAPADRTFREQTIYIPYTRLRETFERGGRGVFLPYEEFDKLWRAARDKDIPTPEPVLPAAFLISEIENDAVVAQDVMRVTARVKIEMLAEGWLRIPLSLADAALVRATIGEAPARVVRDGDAGYQLLIEKKGKTAESLTLQLEYAKTYEKGAGRNRVSFQPPQAPVNRWRIHIPGAGAKVDISPLIAATQIPETAGTTRPADETTVLAFVGAASSVQISWTPRAEGATGLTSLATVQTEQQVQIEDGVVRTRAQLVYTISRAALSELIVEVPADQRVINVADANVRQWSVGPAAAASAPAASAPAASAPAGGTAGRQRITVQLFEPARTTQSIILELEKFISEPQFRSLPVPEVAGIGVGRQQGVVVVGAAEGLRVEVAARAGLLQMDAGELPRSLAGRPWLFSYRYAALPFNLTLRIEKLQPRVVADTLVEATLEPEKIVLDVLSFYTIERVGVFRFEFDLPSGYELGKLNGVAIGDVQPVKVDTHYLEGADKTHLVVNLASKALGRAGLRFTLQRRLAEADLLSPTGRVVNLPLSFPRVTASTVERAAGRLVIHAAESLRVNPGETKNLRSVSFKEAFDNMTSMRDKLGTPGRAVLAFTYAQEEVSLGLLVERRKPQVTVRQLLLAQIEAGVIKYTATFTYDILYSGVPALRIDLPAELVSEVRNNTPGLREKTIAPPPGDLAAGKVAWSFTGETELVGTVQIRLSWEKKLEELAVGKTVEVPLPRLEPRQADRAWGQIVWTKAETLDVYEAGEPKGVRPIDPQHDLMPDASAPGAARALEFHDDWELRIAVTRYKLEEIKRASIERAVIQMVAARGGQTSVRALYRMRSAGQRLPVKLPANAQFDNEPLRIDGKPVPLERGENDTFFVPLVGVNPDTPVLLELRCTVAQGGHNFVLPLFPSEPAIQKVYLCVYLPEESVWLGARGPWTAEMDWQWAPVMGLEPRARRSGAELLDWVRDQSGSSTQTGDTFQTDGRFYLFSALNPTASGGGALRLTVWSDRWFNVLVFGVVMALGIALMKFGTGVRTTAVGTLVILLILSGVFMPTFSRQMLGDALILAMTIVLILWAIEYVVWIRPRDPLVRARREARAAMQLARIRARTATATATASAGAAASSDNPQKQAPGGEPHA